MKWGISGHPWGNFGRTICFCNDHYQGNITDFWGCKKACQDVIGGNYLKRNNFIIFFDVDLHVISNSVKFSDIHLVFIYQEIKKISDSHFMSFLLFHTKTGTVYYNLTEISEKYMYNIELFRTYTFWKVRMNIKMKRLKIKY